MLSLIAAYFGSRVAQAVATAPQESILPSIDAKVETLGTLLTTAPLSIYTEQASSMGAAMAFGAVRLLFLYKAVGNY